MPHVDEFFAATSLAAAGLAAAIALHPAPMPAANDPLAEPSRTVAASVTHPAEVVRLPAVEVVARRGDGLRTSRPAA